MSVGTELSNEWNVQTVLPEPTAKTMPVDFLSNDARSATVERATLIVMLPLLVHGRFRILS